MQGPRLYRFFNYEQSMYLPAPSGGWNPDAMAWDLPLDQAAQLDNFLIRPGKIIVRGGFGTAYSYTAASPNNLCGAVGGVPDWWLLGHRATSSTQTCDPWMAPLVGAPSTQIAQPTTTATFLTPGGAPAAVTVTLDQAPGPRWINFDGLMYGISYGASTAPTTSQDTNATYTTTNTNLLTLPLKQTAGTAPTAHPLAPRGAFDLKGYQSRIWLLGGVDTPGGLTAHEPTTLYFTNPITSGGGFVAADWKDPVTTTTNKIRMDNDITDFGVGLAVVRNGLLIFRRGSVWILHGSTTQSYVLQPIARDVGCIDARSIVETHEGVYWLSTQGLMLTNGTSIVNVSGTLTNTLRDAIFYQQALMTNAGANVTPTYATAQTTSQGQILISIGYHDPTGGKYNTLFSAMYDPATKTWVRITSSIWSSLTGDSSLFINVSTNYNPNMYPGPLIARDNPKVLCAVGDKFVSTMENLFYGYTFLSPENVMNTSGLAGALYDTTPANGVRVIPAKWRTGLLPVVTASKRKWAQGKRIYLDYRLSAVSNFSATPGFQIVPVDTNGIQIGSVILSGPSPMVGNYGGFINNYSVQTTAGPTQVMRANQDWTNEIKADIALEVTLPGDGLVSNSATQAQAEIYGVGLEFQNTSEARTTGSS